MALMVLGGAGYPVELPVPCQPRARTGERPGAHAGRSTGSARTTSALAMTQRLRRTKGGTARLLRRSLIAVRESPGIFPVDSSSGRVATHSAAHALAWVVRARASMTAPQRGKNRPCGTWSGVGTPTTGRSPYPAGSRRRQERPAGTCCTRPTMRSFPPARHAPPRCWKSCGTRSARTTRRSPRRCRPGRVALHRALGLRCLAWPRPPGLAGGWDLGPAGRTHASTGPLSY
jgi:hypothetical protein